MIISASEPAWLRVFGASSAEAATPGPAGRAAASRRRAIQLS
ncbi:hypothetical protein [Streptomyces sp. NPDC048710]